VGILAINLEKQPKFRISVFYAYFEENCSR
jgi:hypothetical protein